MARDELIKNTTVKTCFKNWILSMLVHTTGEGAKKGGFKLV